MSSSSTHIPRIRWQRVQQELGDPVATTYKLMLKWTVIQPLQLKDVSERAEKWISAQLKLVSEVLRICFRSRSSTCMEDFEDTVKFEIHQGTWILFEIPVPEHLWPVLILHLNHSQTEELAMRYIPAERLEALDKDEKALQKAKDDLDRSKSSFEAEYALQERRIRNLRSGGGGRSTGGLFSSDEQMIALQSELTRLGQAWNARKEALTTEIRELAEKARQHRTGLKMELDVDALSYERAFLMSESEWPFKKWDYCEGIVRNDFTVELRRPRKIYRRQWVEGDDSIGRETDWPSWYPAEARRHGLGKELPAYMSCLATLMKPPYPGGKKNFGIVDFGNKDTLEWEDVLNMFKEGAEDLAVDQDSGAIVLSKEQWERRLLTIVKHVNRFLVHVTEGKPLIGVKKLHSDQAYFDWKTAESLKEECAHFRSTYFSPESSKVKNVAFVDEWLKHPKRNVASKMYYRPWPSHWPQTEFPQYGTEQKPPVNTYAGYKRTLLELADSYVRADKNLLRKQWDVMFNNLANCDREVFAYMSKWYAHAVQFPYVRMMVSMVLSGASGIGKGTINQILKDLVGTNFHQVPDGGVQDKFNARVSEKMFVFYDELRIVNNASYNVLKTLVTEPTVDKNQKHIESKQMDNYVHLLINLNSGDLFLETSKDKMDHDDRRFFLPPCPVQTAQENKQLARYVGEKINSVDTDVKKAFMFELMMINVLDFDFKSFPITDRVRHNRGQGNQGGVVDWIKSCLVRRFIIDSPVSEFCRQENDNNYAGVEMPRWVNGERRSGGEYNGGDEGIRPAAPEANDTSFNPLNYSGYRLVAWNKFYGKNSRYLLSSKEWEKIKSIMQKGDAEEDDVSRKDFCCTPVSHPEDFWTNPSSFWMRALPLRKVYQSYRQNYWVKHGKQSTQEYGDFVDQLKVCLPRFFKKTVQLGNGTDEAVNDPQEFLFIPHLDECREYFMRQHPSLAADMDVVKWDAPNELMPAPRLDVLTMHSGDVMDMLREKMNRCPNVNAFVEVMETASSRARSWKMYEPLPHECPNEEPTIFDKMPYYSHMRKQLEDLTTDYCRAKRKLEQAEEELLKVKEELETLKKQRQEEDGMQLVAANQNEEFPLFSQPAASDDSVDAILRDISADNFVLDTADTTVEILCL